MSDVIARAKAWMAANPGKATAGGLALVAACGGAVSPEIRDWLLSVAPIINSVIFGG
ncbi:hypothetical protein [Thalassobaculum litoreum]|uniref:Uncharacterized protein n=1 Tax=Thalassobaculum litoreum DSM 18839 TaxID=1123362 RepID=A0A8G2EVF2_9PROT|nr:hypothetical protein [Thalassobaculum litoreum]SDF84019.1 hypothetical protein SAMN05660686_02492 [Thalassobaculum litoreum DSM 18839]